jgi:hypothetical protein
VQRRGLEFVEALLRWRQRFDITIVERPGSVRAGDFDITVC